MSKKHQVTTTTTHHIALWMLCGAILGAPLLIGSVHWQVALGWMLYMLVVVAFCVHGRLFKTRPQPDRDRPSLLRLSTLSLALLFAACWCALQILPWPAPLVSILSPGRITASELAAQAGLLADASGFWVVPSLDPGASASMGVRFLTLAALVFATENLPASTRRGSTLLLAVGASALLSLAVGLLQAVVTPSLFLGLYQAERAPVLGSTFVNANQSAALCLVGGFAWFVLATSRGIKKQRYRLIFATLGLVALSGVALQGSAGVWLIGAASALCSSIYYLWMKKSATGKTSSAARVVIPAVIVLGWASVWGVAISSVASFGAANEVSRMSVVARAEMVQAALSTSLNFWGLGSGAWSVERTIAPFINWSMVGMNRIETIEAEWMEWFLTLGWPAAMVLSLGLFGAWLGPLFSSRYMARRGAALMGCGVLAMSLAQVHFPFFMVGLGIPMLALWASCRERTLARRFRSSASSESRPSESDEHLESKDRGSSPRARLRRGWIYGVQASRTQPRSVLLVAITLSCCIGFTFRLLGEPGRVFDEELATIDAERARELARFMPSEARLFVQYAREGLDEDPAARLKLYRRAYELEPTPPYRTLLARAAWEAGEREEAVELFSRLLELEGHMTYNKSYLVMLETVRETKARAEIASRANVIVWRRLIKLIDRVEGDIAVQDFLQALTDAMPRDVQAHELLLSHYAAQGRWELVRMQLSLLQLANFGEQEQDKRALLLEMQLRDLLASKQTRRAAAYILDHHEDVRRHERLAAHAIGLMPDIMQLATQKDAQSQELWRSLSWAPERELLLQWFDDLYKNVCVVSLDEQQDAASKLACRLHRPWTIEFSGDLEEAEESWKAVAASLDDPDKLAAFYERQGRCTSLKIMTKQLGAGGTHTKQRAASLRKRIESRYARCTSVE